MTRIKKEYREKNTRLGNMDNLKKWQYKALDKLSTSWDELESMVFEEVYLVLYSVNEGGINPFLEFGLKKLPYIDEKSNELLTFTQIFGNEKEVLFEWIKRRMDILLYEKNTIDGVSKKLFGEKVDKYYENRGFLLEEEKLYIFLDVTEWKKNNIMIMEKRNTLWFVVADEVVEKKNTFLLQWDGLVANFFQNNPEFLLLHNSEGIQYPVPQVVFVPSSEKKLKFIAIFGPSNETKEGETKKPMYPFRSYKEALEEGKEKYDKEGNWGAVRFALFVDETKEIDYEQFVGLSYHFVDKKRMEGEKDHYIL